MKQQLNIFGDSQGVEGGERKAGKAKAADDGISAPAKPKRRRKPREAKKAPMLLDACRQEGKGEELLEEGAGSRERRAGGGDSDLPGAAPRLQKDAPEVQEGPRIYTISEITGRIKGYLEGEFANVWISGEVTDFRNRTGRHYYFALKDQGSKIGAIIFGAEGMRLPFDLVDGLEVVVHGKLNVYAPNGRYSIIIDHIEPKGKGALQLAFEQLKKKLEAEGLFNPERKRPLPFLPRRIGVITSPTGAAIRDIVHVLTRRFPPVDILLYPVRVQGDGAAAEIAEAIGRVNSTGGLDLLIVGRGGGSIEDLWAFNEEVMARAIAASAIPVISAVGHEIDFTIADFVADMRAATPSAAAEIAVPVRTDLLDAIADRRRKLASALRQIVVVRGHEIARLVARMGDPRKRIPDLMQQVDSLRGRLVYAVGVGMERRLQELTRLAGNLNHLSPLGVLAKGYAVATTPDGKTVTSAKSLKIGEELLLRFHKGAAKAKVTKIIDE